MIYFWAIAHILSNKGFLIIRNKIAHLKSENFKSKCHIGKIVIKSNKKQNLWKLKKNLNWLKISIPWNEAKITIRESKQLALIKDFYYVISLTCSVKGMP